MTRRAKELAFVILSLPLLVLVGGWIWQQYSTARDTRLQPPPGQMIDIGGYRLHLVCAGTGTPIVVMDAGLGDSWMTWSKTQPEIARRTTACSYDRAGYAYSDAGPWPRDSKQIVAELHALLSAAKLPPPYILVGHSFGGYNTRLFTSTYPAEVAGLVLVEASHEDQVQRFPSGMRRLFDGYVDQMRWATWRARFGFERVRRQPAYDGPGVQPDQRIYADAVGYRTAWYHAIQGEMESFLAASAREVRDSRRPLTIPLVVITGNTHMAEELHASGLSQPDADSALAAWRHMQDDEATLSTSSHHVIAAHSTHYVNMDQPDLVIGAVDTVLAEIHNTPTSK